MITVARAAPMEARSAETLPDEAGWWYEPKWDGFRCLAFKSAGQIELRAKSGKSLNRFFPEVVESLKQIPANVFALDGELLIQGPDGFSFETLQARLHPAASRIRRLAQETPAVLTLFDMLVDATGADLRGQPLHDRQSRLKSFVRRFGADALTVSIGTVDRDLARSWLDGGRFEGVVAKRLDGPYAEGERAMVKVRRVRTADCVVGGFRYTRDAPVAGSLLLGLYDESGRLNHVGFTSGFAGVDRVALTGRLEALRGGSGFTGQAPGGPSRWSDERSAQWEPLWPEIVVEVSFDHVSAGRFRHGTRLLRFRPDKSPAQCTMEQLQA